MRWHRDLSRRSGDRAWWMAVLFMVGAGCFLVGSSLNFPPATSRAEP